jgi:nucleoside-diphosphate-sugar epimerase
VLIAGCGYVGAAAAKLFRNADWEVEGWTRSANSPELRAVDISDRSAVAAAASSFDAVVHCASSGGGGPEGYRRVYLEGARNLIEILQPGRFLFTSSTSVYAQKDGGWVDEESAAEPTHETGKILRAAEEFVRQNDGAVARLAGIYGPGRSALLRKFLAGEARIEGDGSRILNQVHRDDAASALFLLASAPNEGIFNVADDEPIKQREAYTWLAAKLERPLPATADTLIVRKRGTSSKRVSNRKLRAIGWAPRYPTFQIGMEQSVLPALPTLRA